MDYPANTLATLQARVLTALGRSDAEATTLAKDAINWAALLAAILFKPPELHQRQELTIPNGASSLSLVQLNNWLKVLNVYNVSDSKVLWLVPYDFWSVILPTTTSFKYGSIFGAYLFTNVAAPADKILRVSYSSYPTPLADPADTLSFGGHDAFIVSVATGVCFAFFEEGEAADLWKNVATFVGTPFATETQERNLLEGQWRIMQDVSKR